MILMKYKLKLLVIICIQVITIILGSTCYGLDLRPKIDSFARPMVEDGIAVGFVIGIVKNGQSQIIEYGEKTKGSKVVPDADTLYELSSIGKIFTVILLSDIVQKGIVNLEDPVQEYLPQGIKMPVANGKPITLEHLATHTSGLPRDPDNFIPGPNPYAGYSETQMYEFLIKHKLRRSPGQFEYSSYGMALLGHLLARKMGKTYEQCFIEHIGKPLGMQDTSITLNDSQIKRRASPYNDDLKSVIFTDISPTLVGAGGIWSTCNDMIKFIQANLKDDGKPITQVLHMSHKKRPGISSGIGWGIAPDGTLTHIGRSRGFFSFLSISPSRKIGVVVLANTSSMFLMQFCQKIKQIAFGYEVKQIKPRKTINITENLLDTYTGVYKLAPNNDLTLTTREGKLIMQATSTNEMKYPFLPESKSQFFCRVVDAQINFIMDKDGNVDHLTVQTGGFKQKAFPYRVIEINPEVVESYIGVYTLNSDFDLTITLENVKLMVQATGQNKFQVYPVSDTKFFSKNNDIRIRFAPDLEGKRYHLFIHQRGVEYKGIMKRF